MMTHCKITKIFFLSAFLFFMVPSVFAAEVSFDASKKIFDQNEDFLVSIFVNTDNISLNAFEGKLLFPADVLEEKEIRDGNSLVTFWMQRPKLSLSEKNTQGIISFSGITPGGFLGTKGLLFSFVFRTKKSGNGILHMQDIHFLKNDGEGTGVLIKSSPFLFSVSDKILASALDISPLKDTEPPEDFQPIISRDRAIFDNKFFLVFATQDKGSGIDHYEVREGESGVFSIAESPYVLQNQSLDAPIFVKAIDRAGNERIVKISTGYGKNMMIYFIAFGILFVSGLVVFFVRKKIWKKNI